MAEVTTFLSYSFYGLLPPNKLLKKRVSGLFSMYPSETSRLAHVVFVGELCTQKVMFNLNESNRIVMAQQPCDMRMGVNCLSGQVRRGGLDPGNGDVYIFVGKSRQVMKILHWEHGDMSSTTNASRRAVSIPAYFCGRE